MSLRQLLASHSAPKSATAGQPVPAVVASARPGGAPSATQNAVQASVSVASSPASPVITVDPGHGIDEVNQLLDRASAASKDQNAIVAVVDRGGRILGVRVESALLNPGDSTNFIADQATMTFAIDGAVSLARTAAFFSNDQAPLTSRTVRFISQTTIAQREVESNPNPANPLAANVTQSTTLGPGFVAPIGLGGHFPPDIPLTPAVDLFAIEDTNRDSLQQPGLDGIKGTADDTHIAYRFNVDATTIDPSNYISTPESYGTVSGYLPNAQSRGMATLPGGIPLYKNGTLVGGIGVFFPGKDGYATHEQNFKPNVNQTTKERTNAAQVLEAEWIAFAAAGGSSGGGASVGALGGVAPVAGYDLPFGRIDLGGITLEEYGPGSPYMGTRTILQVGRQVSPNGRVNGANFRVDPSGTTTQSGKVVPEGWLVQPHAAPSGGLTKADVEQAINRGIAQANQTRAAIRLPIGQATKMVFAVSDNDGNILGLYRMHDATFFSIDVAVAKARNMAYYDSALLQASDKLPDPSIPGNAAFTNRTFRFLAEPRYPEGIDGKPPGAFSILNDAGINPANAENAGQALPASVYMTAGTTFQNSSSVLAFAAFNPERNFRNPNLGTPSGPHAAGANQNGIVFFPGSSVLYKNSTVLVGGLGVSGDGVDQDDVVTVATAAGLTPPSRLRADNFYFRNVRLPYQLYDRNPTRF